jgi:hypothetical protein
MNLSSSSSSSETLSSSSSSSTCHFMSGSGSGGGGGGGTNNNNNQNITTSLSSSSYSSSSILNTIDTLSSSSTTTTSSSSIPSSSNTSNTSPLQSPSNTLTTAKDWFTYVYKIDNIEDIIRSHEIQQNFIQSQTFQFKNHYLNTTKQNSNWRLIFYPNGAGQDCKNFLSIFLKYLSDEPVKIQMMFSIVNNNNEDVYVKYTVNKFNKSNDWGFKQLIHKNAILFQQNKFLKQGALSIRIKMRLEEHKNEYIKKLNDNLHYCKILSENFSQYYYQNNSSSSSSSSSSLTTTTTTTSAVAASTTSTTIATSTTTATSTINNNNNNDDNENSSYYDILLVVKNLVESPQTNFVVTESPPTAAVRTAIRRKSTDNVNTCAPPAKRFHTSYSQTSDNILIENINEDECLFDNNFLNTSKSSVLSNDSNYNIVKKSNKTTPSHYCNNCLNKTSTSALASSSTLPINDYFSQHQSTSIIDSKTCNSVNCNNGGVGGLITEVYEFKAHKCILAARSPVFKAMFNYRLKENLTNRVIIEDCKPDVVKAMLKYIYTASLPDDINNIAIDLFIAAEKYYIESLKLKVREHLVENLNSENVLQTYILSELYDDSMLRKQSLKYITENIDQVTQNSDWDEYLKMYPQFFTNAMKRLCKKIIEKTK